jgi:lipoprotein-releasing system ATP-binding protein
VRDASRARILESLDAAAQGRLRNEALGFVTKSTNLLPEFSALENVAMRSHPARAAGRGAPPGHRDARGGRARPSARARPGELSGGSASGWLLRARWSPAPHACWAVEPTGNLERENAARVFDLSSSSSTASTTRHS